MGKQVRFFMLPPDEQAFLQFVFGDQMVVMLADSSPHPELQTMEYSPSYVPEHMQLTTILFWKRVFHISTDDIREVRGKEYREELGAFIETAEVAYRVDTLNAPVIEFSPSFIRRDGRLVKGRIWAEMYRIEGGATFHKGMDFESWYDRIARWLRRNLFRVEGLDGRFGRHALEWYQKGGQVTQ